MNRDQIAEAIEAERAQIAHEIHDALLPLIFAASAAVDRELDQLQQDAGSHQPAEPDKPAEPAQQIAAAPARQTQQASIKRLRQASTWLRDAMRIGRQILTQTHPPELMDDTWDSAARKTIAMLADDSNKSPQIDWQVDIPAQAISVAAANACYRIVVEAIRNAIRHAGATELTVSAKCESGEIVVCVTDNGSGFQIDQVPADRFGIRSMNSRALLAGGKLTVTSQPGGPTTVHLSLPVGA